ncbi:hypothetical protein [Parabacteroides sp. Marseille-P3160]|uniref:hypothetical protein n=1 Tax=Parabacteroides sp. Marseille-P3160 TaxID=1917887 RepID=UPI0009B9702C|nr:hypothetical protein [Parabacteroides sp. Marseille-P3160]
MKKGDVYILDDRHEIFNQYLSQCAFCKHFKDGYTCAAFPDGIPDDLLEGIKKHNSIIKSQTGNLLFSKKKEFK